MKYNPAIHHRKSIRLKGYDYAQAGLYFITFCCEKRMCRFGTVRGGDVVLNEFGKIARDEWLKTAEIRHNTELLEFVIMPNHIHGIIRLSGRGELHSPQTNSSELHSPHSNSSELVSTQSDSDDILNIGVNGGVFKTPVRSPSQTVGAIVRGYKSAVSKQLRLLGFTEKLWQRNYWEYIIRNDNEYQRISNYIIQNPKKWENDKLNNGAGNRVL